MLLAACCTAFFGFFHMGEISIPTSESFDPQRHLGFEDLAVDSVSSPQLARIHLKRSKTDQLGKGADIYLGSTGNDLCPIAALLA